DPLPQPERLPGVARRLEGVEGGSVGRVADRVHRHRPARGGRLAHALGQLLAARDADAGAVQHPGGPRAERAVHEALEVAEPEEVVAEPRAQAQARELAQLLHRQRLPDAQRQALPLVDAAEHRRRSQPAVLVVHGDDAAAVCDADALACRVHPLVLADRDEPLAEAPRRLLAQYAGRLARLVALDDAAVLFEVAARERERGRVEPQREEAAWR